MRFNCNFEDRQSGVSLNVVAILTDAEIQSVKEFARCKAPNKLV
jgi:hypothetical protein